MHAKKRAEQRYGVTLNRHGLRDLVEDIRSGRAQFVERQSNRITLWFVQLGDKTARAVYDKQRGTIVTFLPLEERSEAA